MDKIVNYLLIFIFNKKNFSYIYLCWKNILNGDRLFGVQKN